MRGAAGAGVYQCARLYCACGRLRPVLSANPFSLTALSADNTPAVLIDQSASTIAKGEMMKYARAGRPIPAGWALDSAGNPATDRNVDPQGPWPFALDRRLSAISRLAMPGRRGYSVASFLGV